MKYYRWFSNERYRMFEGIPKEMDALDRNEIPNGKPISHLWQPFLFEFAEKRWRDDVWYDEDKRQFSDFPYLSSTFIVKRLHKMIEPYAEIFPLNIINSDREYYGLNVLKIYDIDYKRSDFIGEDASGIITHAFPDDRLPEAPIFRIEPTKGYYVFFSEEFGEVVKEHRLTGLQFDMEMPYRTGEYQGMHRYYVKRNGEWEEEICYGDDPRERFGTE